MFKYIVLFILSFVVFAIYKAPAHILQNNVKEFTLSGKVIDGVAQHKAIGLVKFEFNPWQILTGKLGFDVRVENKKNVIKTNIAIDILGDIVVSGTTGNIDLNYIKSLIPKFPNYLNSINTRFYVKQLDASIDDLNNFIPYLLNANIVAKDVVLIGEKLGDYNLDVKIKDNSRTIYITGNENSIFKLGANVGIGQNEIVITGDISGKNDIAKELLQNFGINNKLNQKLNF